MAKHKIVVNVFSQKSIENAIKGLQSYQDYLTYKCQLLAEKLAERGVEIARVQVAELDAIFTTELLSSIHSEYKGSVKGGGVWAVVADSSHAVFVEFGTGVIGKAQPYKGTLPEGVIGSMQVVRQSDSLPMGVMVGFIRVRMATGTLQKVCRQDRSCTTQRMSLGQSLSAQQRRYSRTNGE